MNIDRIHDVSSNFVHAYRTIGQCGDIIHNFYSLL
jgi:hypothetical protein